MSARLLRLEQDIYENNQEKDIDLTKTRANFKEDEINLIYSQLKSRLEDLENKVDLYVSKKIEGLFLSPFSQSIILTIGFYL